MIKIHGGIMTLALIYEIKWDLMINICLNPSTKGNIRPAHFK
jgi:hypothetical protein